MQIHALSARELLLQLSSRKLSAVELVTACLERSASVDAKVRGFVHLFSEQALADAKRSDEQRQRGEALGPLHGLPVSVKESVDTKGVASTLGMRGRLSKIAERDAVVVRLLREAGAIILGKTNVPQTLLSPMETTNFIWGRSNNPWNIERGTGGSSGGEGVVLATGQTPLGIGTDIGGSIRFPAAFCGVSGLKPTLHRWSNVGSNTAILGQEVIRSQIGPMARNTADVALLLRALASPLHAPFDQNVPPLDVGDPTSVDLKKLRIGYYLDDGFITPAASCQRAVKQAVQVLREAGAELVEFTPPCADEITYLFFAVMSADGQRTLSEALAGEAIIQPLKLLRLFGRMPRALRNTVALLMHMTGEERVSRMLSAVGRRGVEKLWALTAERSRFQSEEQKAWDYAKLDALVCPVHTTPATPHGMSKDFTIAFCYAARYNLLNLPAGTVPVTRVRADETKRSILNDRLDKRAAQIEAQSEGLPVGVQVVGRPWQEHVVLAVMQAIEERVRDTTDFPRTPIDPV